MCVSSTVLALQGRLRETNIRGSSSGRGWRVVSPLQVTCSQPKECKQLYTSLSQACARDSDEPRFKYATVTYSALAWIQRVLPREECEPIRGADERSLCSALGVIATLCKRISTKSSAKGVAGYRLKKRGVTLEDFVLHDFCCHHGFKKTSILDCIMHGTLPRNTFIDSCNKTADLYIAPL